MYPLPSVEPLLCRHNQLTASSLLAHAVALPCPSQRGGGGVSRSPKGQGLHRDVISRTVGPALFPPQH